MVPLALYIHWPFCKAKCPYCDFNSHVRERVEQDAWREALLAELAHMAGLTPGRTVASIFFGGGTPSLMPPATAGALIDAAAKHWNMAEDVEITLEANPTSSEASAFEEFKAAGVNRASLGVQALNERDLGFLGRKHNVSEAKSAVNLAAKTFSRYSFDLIYARPGQTAAGWERELREALAMAGDHLSLYQLTIEENTGFHAAYARGEFVLPPEEDAAEMYARTQNIMTEAGLPAYEISNHAVPGAESRHNLAYWRGQEYAGVGPGAHGRIRDAEEKWQATLTLKSPERWLEAVRRDGHGLESMQPLSVRERQEERLMMGLRLTEGMRADEVAVDAKALTRLRGEGLLASDKTRLRATPRGALLLNYVIGELLP